jgi:lipid A disaccharide synthetase
MQDDLTSENVVKELLKLLDPETNKTMREQLREVAHRLGEPGASQRAAAVIVECLQDDRIYKMNM